MKKIITLAMLIVLLGAVSVISQDGPVFDTPDPEDEEEEEIVFDTPDPDDDEEIVFDTPDPDDSSGDEAPVFNGDASDDSGDEFTDEELIDAFGTTGDPYGRDDPDDPDAADPAAPDPDDAADPDAQPQSTYGDDPNPGTVNAANLIRGYQEYQGLAAYTTLIWPEYGDWVAENRARLNEQFCAATGIGNCLQSRICGSIIPVGASNVLAGTGPTGQVVSSASIVAEKSLPLEVEGLSTQRLIELFGGATSTMIAGQRVDFADPDFDPAQLGPIKLRLYHVQFGLTNNAESGGTLGWNVEFMIGQNIRRRWYSPDQLLDYGAQVICDGTPGCHLYKLSATEYTDVCMVFDTGLPSGTTYGQGIEWFNPSPTFVNHICTPIVEYSGGPTSVVQASAGTQPSTAPTSSGGNI